MQISNVNKSQLLINWLLIIGAIVTPPFVIYELTYDEGATWAFGVFFAIILLFVVGNYLPSPFIDKQREREIHEAKLDLSVTKDTLRDEMAKLMELEDKYSGGQVHLSVEIEKQKKTVDFWQSCLESCQSKLNQLEEEDKKWRGDEKVWHDLQQRADDRLSQTNSTYAHQSEHNYKAISEK